MPSEKSEDADVPSTPILHENLVAYSRTTEYSLLKSTETDITSRVSPKSSIPKIHYIPYFNGIAKLAIKYLCTPIELLARRSPRAAIAILQGSNP